MALLTSGWQPVRHFVHGAYKQESADSRIWLIALKCAFFNDCRRKQRLQWLSGVAQVPARTIICLETTTELPNFRFTFSPVMINNPKGELCGPRHVIG